MLRVWDLLLFEGSKTLFRTSLALLLLHRYPLHPPYTTLLHSPSTSCRTMIHDTLYGAIGLASPSS
eukprot:3000928-Rhodomonas_salina.1